MDTMTPTPKQFFKQLAIALLLIFICSIASFVIGFRGTASQIPRMHNFGDHVGEVELKVAKATKLMLHDTYEELNYQPILRYSHFHGAQNLAEAQEYYGTLLLAAKVYDSIPKESNHFIHGNDRFSEAIVFLSQAAREPHPRIGAYRPWVLALEASGHYEEAEALFPEWETAALAEENLEAQVDLLEARARHAKRNDDLEAYSAHLSEATALAPGSAATALWGRHLVAKGKYAEATEVFDAWLWGGGRLYGGAIPQADDGRLAATLAAWELALTAAQPSTTTIGE